MRNRPGGNLVALRLTKDIKNFCLHYECELGGRLHGGGGHFPTRSLHAKIDQSHGRDVRPPSFSAALCGRFELKRKESIDFKYNAGPPPGRHAAPCAELCAGRARVRGRNVFPRAVESIDGASWAIRRSARHVLERGSRIIFPFPFISRFFCVFFRAAVGSLFADRCSPPAV
jgi:hypothetical protein